MTTIETDTTSAVQETWISPFQGEDPCCPKCGSRRMQTEFHTCAVVSFCKEDRDKLLQLADDPSTIEDELTEHLCRGCNVCGYAWREHVAPPGWRPERKTDDDE